MLKIGETNHEVFDEVLPDAASVVLCLVPVPVEKLSEPLVQRFVVLLLVSEFVGVELFVDGLEQLVVL